jgi:hypothetical protein
MDLCGSAAQKKSGRATLFYTPAWREFPSVALGFAVDTKRIDKRFILKALEVRKAMISELLNALRTPPQPQPLKVHHRTVMILVGFCASSLSAVILIAILRGRHYLLLVVTIFPLFIIWSVSGRFLKRAIIGKSVNYSA